MRPALFVAVLACGVPIAHAAGDCDRECLRGFVTQYLAALVAHNPGALPVAGNVRFTEDSVTMPLGEGFWKIASRPHGYRVDILDVSAGIAASQVVMEAGDSPMLLTLRLKVADRKITEIETMVTHNQKEGALFKPDGIQTKAMPIAPDASLLPSREEAIRLAGFYPAGLKVGSFVSVNAPFAPDAYRVENGVISAGPGCSRAGCENIQTQTIMKHPDITNRVVAVDEQLGIVLLRMNFGNTGSYGPGNALIVWEAFKVYGGQIHAVEAFMKVMPATTGSGWE